MRERSIFRNCVCRFCPFLCLSSTSRLLMCMNYSCICGCGLKYCFSPQFLIPVETSKGFKQECLSVGVLLARTFWQQCPTWRSASVGREGDRGAEVEFAAWMRNGGVSQQCFMFTSFQEYDCLSYLI